MYVGSPPAFAPMFARTLFRSVAVSRLWDANHNTTPSLTRWAAEIPIGTRRTLDLTTHAHPGRDHRMTLLDRLPVGILICMREPTTTVRLSRSTRDNLRHLADDDGVTLDDEIIRLVRSERQRRIGQALSASELDTGEQSWIEIGGEAVRNDAGR
ncbi:MAG: hypothetical protein NVS3B12_08710 [Acidimicrobiales bacterium]